ncbi:MAG: tRNA (guanosine(37)-N1)-methyltransferase TrmD [Polyangiales bacterium]|nr:tRNA (guanosine(37)-N1)-methyltransferase TrmD [Myxococcales bacterium]MCB9658927.1 tRNA (guanosine(37)-N1)-methyltransferase TrmD [Sandaracinaceae bacterium]
MRFEVVTLFPELFAAADVGLLGKARERGDVSLTLLSPREFATDKHRSVDDYPYGGGSGMVLMPGPVVDALEHLDRERGLPERSRRVLLSPQGVPFDQRAAERLSTYSALTLVCGRYEGFDERIRSYVDEEISLGDFVLLGGEIAALAVIEATARLLPGVLGNEQSAADESHTSQLLEYPQYTRPPEFRGQGIPEILMSGHHAKIAAWRKRESVRRTLQRRPDLLAGRELTPEVAAVVASVRAELGASPPDGDGT